MHNQKKMISIVIILIIVILISIKIVTAIMTNEEQNNTESIDNRNQNNSQVNNNHQSKESTKYVIVNSNSNINNNENNNSKDYSNTIHLNENAENDNISNNGIRKMIMDVCTDLINNPYYLIDIDSSRFDVDYINSTKNELYMLMHTNDYPQSIDGLMTVSPKFNQSYSVVPSKEMTELYIDENNIAYMYKADIMDSESKYTDVTITVIIDTNTYKIKNIGNIKYGAVPKPNDTVVSNLEKSFENDLKKNGQNSITMNPSK